ncbi:alpha/beta hydrolase [Aestuariibacter halophilus]|uniref:Alpha/beta hydrolase n=1 Tax=Fluctibacter halophilus TaxID=226011 RepID=A0ABS8G3P8_9ALTE|nr:alpha/beta hydrolase [Aestuariibacter halophilus]MCC2615217.1 alpha/beta hydrolase [Aestuariibacter halophilus]
MTDIQSHYLEIQGLRLHTLCAGDADNPVVLFLHGFPEASFAWDPYLQTLSDHFCVYAFDLPGYNDSDALATPQEYQIPSLLEILARFIEHIGRGKPIYLVAHDWGGALAWPLAAFYPQLIARLLILNAPHPAGFTRALRDNPRQRQQSAYIHQLVAADMPDILVASDFALLREMLFEGRLDKGFSDAQQQRYLDSWRKPGRVQGMLQYYHQMPQMPPAENDPNLHYYLEQMRIPSLRVQVPTLVLWGMQDKAFVPEVLDTLEDWVAEVDVMRVNNASHWIHHEQPDIVIEQIRRFFSP